MFRSTFVRALPAFVLVLAATIPSYAGDAKPSADVDQTVAPIVSWKNPLVRPRFALLCIHGLGLNSRSYTDFARRISLQGAAVYAIDVRGFGSWMKAAGHENVDFEACLGDVKMALQTIRAQNPTLPVFLLGESMGGAIALRATSLYPELIDGLISCVPAEERFKTKKTDLKVAVEVLKGPKNDMVDIGKDIVAQATTADRIEDGKKVQVVNDAQAADWQNDPLNRMDLSPKELMQFQKFMNDNHDAVKKIDKTPVLFVAGLDDRLVKPEGTFELVQEIQTPDRMMTALPTRHLVFEETQSIDPRVNRISTQIVLGWIAAHMPGKDDSDTANFGSNSPTTTATPSATTKAPAEALAPRQPAGLARRPAAALLRRRAQLRAVGK